MANFDNWYKLAQKWEGGYVNDPNDRGGETYAGIARKFNPEWKGWAFIDAQKQKAGGRLPKNWKTNNPALLNEVKKTAKENYWNKVSGDRIKNQAVANLLADAIWGGGGVATIRRMQTHLGVEPDGKIGADTLKSMNNFDSMRLFLKLKEIRRDHFEAASRLGNNITFFKGWLNRLADFNYVPDSATGLLILLAAGLIAFLIYHK